MQKEWTALLSSEAAYALNPASSKIMNVIRWRHYKSIRMLYLMAEEMDWKVTPQLQQYMRDMLGGLADTKIIEDTHQKLRDLVSKNKQKLHQLQGEENVCLHDLRAASSKAHKGCAIS